jgi:hypothetical protein
MNFRNRTTLWECRAICRASFPPGGHQRNLEGYGFSVAQVPRCARQLKTPVSAMTHRPRLVRLDPCRTTRPSPQSGYGRLAASCGIGSQSIRLDRV